ncbi:hypothetical protein Ga0609869_001843 [Rhodovulum iodosum]|uniref:Uncharacterized protein n=1 Tax=Rhodovulum iodosum TaxID=68291 RepID=A0ABV3XT23_9RHOB|nr:hypothetical protein [Rhodovulum robiginosum]MCR9147768.1 hypothetical protein [Paracoccaceae bacterium]RSK39008.1 hypothetical protein EJA01_01345 [Rhodovulum robiginosum]
MSGYCEELTAEFSFAMQEAQTKGDLAGRNLLEAATDVMRQNPIFLHKRKDGGLYQQSRTDTWDYVGSAETVIVGASTNWVVVITAIGGGRYTARVLPAQRRRCWLQSFRELEKQAA